MDQKKTGKGSILARVISMALAAALLAVVIVLAEDIPPTVHIEGLELRMVAEYETDQYGQYVLENGKPKPKLDSNGNQLQSVQALVSISVSDADLNTGFSLPLHYNTDYLSPSDWKTNGLISELKDSNASADDSLHHSFFRVDEGLYAGNDPFVWGAGVTDSGEVGGLAVNNNSDILTLHLALQRELTIPQVGENKIAIFKWGGRPGGNDRYVNVPKNTSTKDMDKVAYGTISFRVNDTYLGTGTGDPVTNLQANLKKLVDKFVGENGGDGRPVDGSSDGPLLETYMEGNEKLVLWGLFNRFGNQDTTQGTTTAWNRAKIEKNIQYRINLDSEDVIIKAEPVKDEIVINAYQAFTDGNVSDLALAMQKYAESVRVTYVSENQADMSIYWGDPNATSVNKPADAPGMFIQEVRPSTEPPAPVYRFTWNSSDPKGYTFEEKQADGSFAPADPNGFYDPRKGDYMISQYFTYMENDGIPSAQGGTAQKVLKTYQTPIKVHLTVVPVTAVDAVVDKDSLTYLNDIDDVPKKFHELQLAEDVRLVLDTTLDGVTPTVPADWTPGDLDPAITGVPGPGNPREGTADPAVWPRTKSEIDDKTGIGSYTFTTLVEETNVAGTGIRDRYPWLSVDPDWLNDTNGHMEKLDAMRHIVKVEGAELADRFVAWAEPYEDPLGSPIGRLRVTVAKRNEDDTAFEDMNNYDLRLFMPNGQEIRASQWFGSSTGTNAWSDASTGASYRVEGPVVLYDLAEGKNGYMISISPGMLGAADTYAPQREILRRYINLGGWFGIQVRPQGQTAWSDLIPVFSGPRRNIYIHSYDRDDVNNPGGDEPYFDYTGTRMGLMPFYKNSVLPAFVTLPADDEVAVQYDPADGHQPGAMRQFKVDAWTQVSGSKGSTAPTWQEKEIVTYGLDLFAREHVYSDMGRVFNPDTVNDGYAPAYADKKVRVDVQVQDKSDPAEDPKSSWDLLLTYEDTGDNISYIPNTTYGVNEVKRVTFDNKQEGYTYQQIVTLTLTNVGNQEIKGLYIDVPTLTGASGPYFTIISAPAVNLPVGAKTTFQISYVQNLHKGTYENTDDTIPVKIYHNNNVGAPKTFEAVLRVTEFMLNRVDLVVHPDDPDPDPDPAKRRGMGDAGLVNGVTTTNGVDAYDGTMAGNTYEKDEIFWVYTTPKDEYSLLTLKDANEVPHVQVYYIEEYTDDGGQTVQQKVYLNEYLPEGPNPGFGATPATGIQAQGNERLFWIAMPDHPVTVHVHYYEPLYSKLRLSDLHAYSWEKQEDAVWDGTATPPGWTDDPAVITNPATDLKKYEKKLHGKQEEGYPVIVFDKDKDEYLVILDEEGQGNTDNWCGVSVTLRALEVLTNGVDPDCVNQDIFPTVIMYLEDGPGVLRGAEPLVGDTSGPTTHRSELFEAPLAGSAQNGIAQKTLVIKLSYDGTKDGVKDKEPPQNVPLIPEEKAERTYKVRFVRKATGEAKNLLAAGNSPYGMIENDGTIIDKAAAKEEFDKENRFTTACMPHKATELTNIYWPEAWTGGINYDKDETALFVYLGQEFYDPGATRIYNNAGDLIDGIEVRRSLRQYYQMDLSKESAMERFSNGAMNPSEINLGVVWATKGAIPGEPVTVGEGATAVTYSGTVSQFADVTDVRPGIYRLTYTFEDYDHTTMLSFSRPLIVLSANGDVNADGSLSTSVKDADTIRKRFSEALPLELTDPVYSQADRRLYRYRIVDANNDRNINNVDANLIRKVTAFFLPEDTLTQFYRPTDYIYPTTP